MRVSTGVDVSSAPSIEQSAIVSERGYGCDCDRDFRGRGLGFVGGGRGYGRGRGRDFGRQGLGFVRGGRGSYGGSRVPVRKDLDNVGTVDAVITSSRSTGRNLVDLSGHNFLSLTPLLRVALLRTIRPLPPLFPDFSLLLQEGYDRLRQLEFSQNNLSATHAFTSSIHAYTASSKAPNIRL